ncbi:hypothetical protein [Paraburkholderia caballeronis]|uniref:FlxA-like protein n=1 Tax=Paraburkholderia caballeronis TaxID=416943 RepID=A0A1H7TK63_9BURK|nr:hypothetical protein [Paraburkholderia caballeronis]PXW18438.1 hypothetical protein C7403_116125 [Paraburkholderia caballeronis]PXW95718.1 hypothetical protein C7407_116125 [Paraburkholderia caballeronis]RAJ92064.1 hypothetical protein C7409_116125 [Paraburkholderia caballeronis]SEB75889.1 hypothetical protein SAMN05445871_1013 [Paraburkholderia caballeronis]SEL85292.1 hypothetical protein SAMN05192542_115125 [Paraburkholderia caballeronis]
MTISPLSGATPVVSNASTDASQTASGQTSGNASAGSGSSAASSSNKGGATGAGGGGAVQPSGSSSTSASTELAVQELKKLIEQLQQQLRSIEARLAELANRNRQGEPDAQAQTAALQQQASSIQAALSIAESSLANLLSGKTSSVGSNVDTTA